MYLPNLSVFNFNLGVMIFTACPEDNNDVYVCGGGGGKFFTRFKTFRP